MTDPLEDPEPCVRCGERPRRSPKQKYCKQCHSEYMREYRYERRKEREREREKVRRQKEWERKKLAMTHCPHCGKVLLENGSDHVVAVKETGDE